MELTSDDIQFFSDEENWMFGPTYDLEIFTEADTNDLLQHAISSFPSLIAWKPRDAETRSICALGEPFRPFGVLHYCINIRRELHKYFMHLPESQARGRLVIYPPHMLYVCGQEIWQEFNTDSSIAALGALHHRLLEWVRWVHGQVPIMSAIAFDETRAMPGDLDIPQHHFWVHNSVAQVISWTGTRAEDWVGVSI